MSSKNSSKKPQAKKKDNTAKKNVKKDIPKRKCVAPIAHGHAMAQRTLPSTVCCPPNGCLTSCCLQAPGYNNC